MADHTQYADFHPGRTGPRNPRQYLLKPAFRVEIASALSIGSFFFLRKIICIPHCPTWLWGTLGPGLVETLHILSSLQQYLKIAIHVFVIGLCCYLDKGTAQNWNFTNVSESCPTQMISPGGNDCPCCFLVWRPYTLKMEGLRGLW